MAYTVAAFFSNLNGLNLATKKHRLERNFLGYPLNHNGHKTPPGMELTRRRRFPVVLFETTSPTPKPFADDEVAIQETIVLNMNFELAYAILKQQGRRALRRRHVRQGPASP